jgi:Bifunctional DNA primase/polymerase, N-terminal
MSAVLEAAMEYAARGWPVFPCHSRIGPCCTCGKAECASPAKHPRTRNGLKDATTDPVKVRQWFLLSWPPGYVNIGIATGVAFDALDVDGPDAEAALDGHLGHLAPADDETIDGPTVKTGRGWHVYLEPTGHRNRTGIIPGVDWRGAGGYVVAPPSVHYNGSRYEWELPGDPVFGADAPLQPARPWLLELLEKRKDPVADVLATDGTVAEFLSQADTSRYGQAALEGELGRLVMVPVGERNAQLNRSAHALGRLVGGAVLDAGLVVDRLLVAAQRIGLGEREAEATIKSGLRAGIANPRRIPA